MQYFKLPAGVRDILPAESEKLDAAEETLRKKFRAAGFSSVRTAGLEYYDTFANIKSSVEQNKMFKMTDKDGNLIVLRPDMTLACARIAGIMAAKRTHELIPLCHPLPLTGIEVELTPVPPARVRVTATARCDWKTGVEMEALTAASVAALTVYDMCKAVDRGMTIEQVCLLEKAGGRSGHFVRPDPHP